MFYKFLFLLLLTLFFGCASVTHTPVVDNDTGTGIRYYQSSPYLLVYSDCKGGLQWQILFLPDQTKKMMVDSYAFLSKEEMTLFFKNGICSGVTEVGDTTELPKAVIAAVQSAAPLLMHMLRGPEVAVAPTAPAPYLFKIKANGDSVEFIGSHSDTHINITTREEN